ncbi:hypothetical protein E2C01_048747 [Portunus trituberculatus]|uniref:Uncharacterized protein n=1 Tax=Portunus trituberculatus TaxID=210409 RepID=A0A5B7GAZ9_PORTR|nr:hypothetical protein [Portunus trituberculatus]
MKYLDKLGLQVERVTDKISSSGRKKKKAKQKKVYVARQSSRARHGSSSRLASVKPSKRRGLVKSTFSMVADHRDTRSVHERISMQVDESSSQSVIGGGPSGLVHKPQRLFSNIDIAWQLKSYDQQPAHSQRYTSNALMTYHQPDQYQFNLTRNEFWGDYSVNMFPWSQ